MSPAVSTIPEEVVNILVPGSEYISSISGVFVPAVSTIMEEVVNILVVNILVVYRVFLSPQ